MMTDTWSTADRSLFFHFSGFDAKRPYLLSKHQGERPRVLLSANPALQRLCAEYLADIHCAGHEQASASPYGWKVLPSGEEYSARMRRCVEALEAHKRSEAPTPCPFDRAAPGRFVDWLEINPLRSAFGRGSPAFSRSGSRRSPKGFPESRWGRWSPVHPLGARSQHRRGANTCRVTAIPYICPSNVNESTFASASQLSEGVNIVGYLQANSGIGEAARRLITAVKRAQHSLPRRHHLRRYSLPAHSIHFTSVKTAGNTSGNIDVLSNADQTPILRSRKPGRDSLTGDTRRATGSGNSKRFSAGRCTRGSSMSTRSGRPLRFVAGRPSERVGGRPVFTVPPAGLRCLVALLVSRGLGLRAAGRPIRVSLHL